MLSSQRTAPGARWAAGPGARSPRATAGPARCWPRARAEAAAPPPCRQCAPALGLGLGVGFAGDNAWCSSSSSRQGTRACLQARGMLRRRTQTVLHSKALEEVDQHWMCGRRRTSWSGTCCTPPRRGPLRGGPGPPPLPGSRHPRGRTAGKQPAVPARFWRVFNGLGFRALGFWCGGDNAALECISRPVKV